MVSPQLVEIVKKYEGCKLTPYICPSGVPTIGYGATFYEDYRPVSMKDPAITQEEAEKLLRFHLELFGADVDLLIKPALNDNQLAALISLTHNIGITEFSTSTILRKVNANPVDPSIRDEFRRWNKSNGNVLPGLCRRRKEEGDLYFSALKLVSIA